MRHALSTPNAARSETQFSFGAILLLASLLAASAAGAQTRLPNVERFTATTTAMTPSDVELRIDVREWSDEPARAAVVAALEGDADAAQALKDLPTVGYVWQQGSGVGYAVKYAHRASTPEGERVTFVTDKRVGSYEFKPWTVEAGSPAPERAYSVIELYLTGEGNGAGTMSLGAEVRLDAENALVSLAPVEGTPNLLANAKQEPQPYWAKSSY